MKHYKVAHRSPERLEPALGAPQTGRELVAHAQFDKRPPGAYAAGYNVATFTLFKEFLKWRWI
ncbi:MAG: hypothetical protein KAV82_06390, partial [Phycisphaerae bacterium]|nr:hypothetical protein [Phycisphaerae bacterium]